MANLLSKLRAASFRGISFMVPSDDAGYTRRVISHEYPGRDGAFHEDLGEGINDFNFEAVIAGLEYLNDADAFETALRKSGPALLIHPHYGSVTVIVKSFRRSHSTDSVGEVRFSVTVEKFGALVYPTALSDTVFGLTNASNSLFSAISEEFAQKFNIDGLQDFLVNDAVAQVSSFGTVLDSTLSHNGLIDLARKVIPASWNPVLDLGQQVFSIFQSIGDAVKPSQKPAIGTNIASQDSVSARSVLTAMIEGTGIESSSISGNSRRAVNARAIEYAYRTSALATAATAAKYTAYESREEALSIRSALSQKIEALRDDLGNDGYDKSWIATGDVLAAFTKDINDRLGRLPRTVKIQPSAPRSSLALAQRLYGDDPSALFSRAEDIAGRNKVRHPGMVPAAQIEVLING